MQDKPLNIDEKFTDKAWSEMSILLDREMPVQPNKRRLGLAWWWLGLVGIAVLVGGGYLFFGKKAGANPITPVQPVASAVQPSSQNKAVLDLPTAESQNLSNESTIQSKSASVPQLQKNQKSDFVATQKPVAQSSSKQLDLYFSTTQNNLAGARVIDGKRKSEQPSNSTEIVHVEQAEKVLQDNVATPTGLTSLAISPLNPLENPFENNPSVAAKLDEKNRIGWAIQSNWLTVPNLTGGGFSVEALASKQLVSRQLSLEMGGGYAYLKQPIYAGVKAINVTTTEQDGRIGYENSNYTSDLVSSPAIDTVYRNRYLDLHYLTMPVQVSYQFSNRFRAKAGLNTGVLLASRSSYTQSGLLENVGLASDNKSSVGQIAKVSIVEIAATAGFSFQFNRAASLHVDYVHGLTDVLPQNQVGDFNRLLKVGIRYNLNGGR